MDRQARPVASPQCCVRPRSCFVAGAGGSVQGWAGQGWALCGQRARPGGGGVTRRLLTVLFAGPLLAGLRSAAGSAAMGLQGRSRCELCHRQGTLCSESAAEALVSAISDSHLPIRLFAVAKGGRDLGRPGARRFTFLRLFERALEVCMAGSGSIGRVSAACGSERAPRRELGCCRPQGVEGACRGLHVGCRVTGLAPVTQCTGVWA